VTLTTHLLGAICHP